MTNINCPFGVVTEMGAAARGTTVAGRRSSVGQWPRQLQQAEKAKNCSETFALLIHTELL